MSFDTILDALAIPPDSRINQRIPKKLLSDQGGKTASDRRNIQDGVEELLWVAALKPINIGVAAFRDQIREYVEIAILTVQFRESAKETRLAIGFQSISGLRDPKLYGQHLTDDILGQISNRFCGRLECPETAEFMSRIIGDAEVRQLSESRSHNFKGGTTTSQNWQPVIRRAILPSEFMSVTPCDDLRGLTGLVTTRSDLPTWDHLPPDQLFDEMLIPPAEDVPDFVPRDPFTQFVTPWTDEQAEQFAPRNSLREDRRKHKKSKTPEKTPENDLDDLDL